MAKNNPQNDRIPQILVRDEAKLNSRTAAAGALRGLGGKKLTQLNQNERDALLLAIAQLLGLAGASGVITGDPGQPQD